MTTRFTTRSVLDGLGHQPRGDRGQDVGGVEHQGRRGPFGPLLQAARRGGHRGESGLGVAEADGERGVDGPDAVPERAVLVVSPHRHGHEHLEHEVGGQPFAPLDEQAPQAPRHRAEHDVVDRTPAAVATVRTWSSGAPTHARLPATLRCPVEGRAWGEDPVTNQAPMPLPTVRRTRTTSAGRRAARTMRRVARAGSPARSRSASARRVVLSGDGGGDHGPEGGGAGGVGLEVEQDRGQVDT